MDAVDLEVRHIAFVHDEMWQIEQNDERHYSERSQASQVRKACAELLES